MNVPGSEHPRVWRTVAGVAAALLVLVLLVWQVSQLVLTLFSATLVAVVLTGLARPMMRWTHLPRRPAVVLAAVTVVAALALLLWLAGPQVSTQIDELRQRLPEAMERLQTQFKGYEWSTSVLQVVTPGLEWLPAPGQILGRISGVFSTAFGAVAYVALTLIMGFYLALDPGLYRRGILLLVPQSAQNATEDLLNAIGHALHWWLAGQLLAMGVIAVLIGIGLWIIDMPMVLALALIAGVLAFIPYIGPVVSALPAVLVAFVDDPFKVVYVLAVYGGVQFLEGNFITPLIQRRMVSLAPALLLSAQLLMGVLFGFLGILLATPLAVTVVVAVQVLYVQRTLRHSIHRLGQHD